MEPNGPFVPFLVLPQDIDLARCDLVPLETILFGKKCPQSQTKTFATSTGNPIGLRGVRQGPAAE